MVELFVVFKDIKMKARVTKRGFTIIELLTVMSIIVILIALLVPSLNSVRRYSKVVRQKGQFHDLGTGLEMFSIDFDGYPDSKRTDGDATPLRYCGAMKLCEAMIGQDGLGFHPDSRFFLSGLDKNFKDLYPSPVTLDSRRERKHTYVDTDKYKRCPIDDLYGSGNISPFVTSATGELSVLCDVFAKTKGQISGDKLGMPILYYKADVTKVGHDPNVANLDGNIYDVRDNHELTGLMVNGAASPPEEQHPLHYGIVNEKTGYEVFYANTRNNKITNVTKPYNENTFVLISAGWDGLYGTRDDVYNFAE